MADTRLFKLTYSSGTVRYGDRKVVGPAAAYSEKSGNYSYRLGTVELIEATDAGATTGWADVTDEFIKEES